MHIYFLHDYPRTEVKKEGLRGRGKQGAEWRERKRGSRERRLRRRKRRGKRRRRKRDKGTKAMGIIKKEEEVSGRRQM